MNKKVRRIIPPLTIFFCLLTVIESYFYSSLSGGTDLRNRIVGSRLMASGRSPYFYKWHSGDGQSLLDPNDNPTRLANGNTVTPAVFILTYPLNQLNYPVIRFAWTTLQLLLILGTVWMMQKSYEGKAPWLATAVVTLSLFASDYWVMNIERGQIQVLYVFLFAVMYYVYKSKWRYGEFTSGLVGGLFIFFRPFAGIIFLGFLLHRRFNWIKGWITGLLMGLAIFLLPNITAWKEYYKAMEEYGNECIGQGHRIPISLSVIYPPVIEGASNLRQSVSFRLTNLPAVYGVVKRLGFTYTSMDSFIISGILIVILSYFFVKQKKQSSSVHLFLFAFITYMVAELFMLGWRSPYAVISWVFPLFLVMQRIQQNTVLIVVLCTALSFLHNYPFGFRFQADCAELILLSFVCYSCFSSPVTTDLGFKT